MTSPENTYFVENESPLSPDEQVVYDWWLKHPRSIQDRESKWKLTSMNSFKGSLYPPERVEQDKEEVKKLRSKDTKEVTQRSELFEVIIKHFAEGANWFGADCFVHSTCEYDDRKNNSDAVLEWVTDEDPVYLAIDCTTSENPDVIQQKTNKVLNKINNGKLTTIKYFESEIDGQKQALKYVPSVVLNIPKDKLRKLSESIAAFINNSSNSADEVANNKIPIDFLHNIQEQLIEQIDYAGRCFSLGPKKQARLISNIKKVLDLISNLIKEKTPDSMAA